MENKVEIKAWRTSTNENGVVEATVNRDQLVAFLVQTEKSEQEMQDEIETLKANLLIERNQKSKLNSEYKELNADLARVKQENEAYKKINAEVLANNIAASQLNNELAEIVQTVVDRNLVAGPFKEECIAALTKHKGE